MEEFDSGRLTFLIFSRFQNTICVHALYFLNRLSRPSAQCWTSACWRIQCSCSSVFQTCLAWQDSTFRSSTLSMRPFRMYVWAAICVVVTAAKAFSISFFFFSIRESHINRHHFCSQSSALRTHSVVSFAVTLPTSRKSTHCCWTTSVWSFRQLPLLQYHSVRRTSTTSSWRYSLDWRSVNHRQDPCPWTANALTNVSLLPFVSSHSRLYFVNINYPGRFTRSG